MKLFLAICVFISAEAFAQCANSVNDNAQTLCGTKTFSGDVNVNGALYSGLIYTPGDAYLGGIVRLATNGQAFLFFGRRYNGDTAAEFSFYETNYRDPGSYIVDYRAYGNESVYAVDNVGNVFLRGHANSGGYFGSLHDGTGVSGHALVVGAKGQSLTIQGRLGEGACAKLVDGGTENPDGGCMEPAMRHGDNSASSSVPRSAGMVQDWQNPRSGSGAYSDKVAFVDYNGGFGQGHGLSRNQFGECPSRLVMVKYPGSNQEFQFRYGQEISALMYANDLKRWFMCTDNGWVKLATEGDINEINSRLDALESN